MTEWRDIPGYEGHYQASVDGDIRSLARSYVNRAGVLMPIRERILRPGASANYPYLSVVLRTPDGSKRSAKVHQLVALAFHGRRPFPAAEVCHNDGNHQNNTASNLRWATRSENGLDSVRHGSNIQARKVECPQGHPYDEQNTVWRRRHSSEPTARYRVCATCNKENQRRYYERKTGIAS